MKDLRRIQQAAVLAEHAHFGRAARAMGISQPALTLAIQSLERELGVRLFDRDRGRATPTEFGRIVLRYGDGLLGSAREMLREISMHQNLDAGELYVAAGTYAADVSGSTAIGRLVQRYPNLQCRLHICPWQDAISPVLAREADVALCEIGAAAGDERLVAQPVGRHPCVFFCQSSHPILNLRRTTIGAITAYPWAFPSLPARVYENFNTNGCNAGRLDENAKRFIPAVRIDTLASAKPVVRESDAISAAPPMLIWNELRTGEFVAINYRADWLRLDYGLIFLRDRTLSPAARQFMQEVRAVESHRLAESRVIASMLRRRYEGSDLAELRTASSAPPLQEA